MTASFHIEDEQGTRAVSAGDFPLALGGRAADIKLPGISEPEPSAWLGLSDGQIFLQSEPGGETVTCNGMPVVSSQWLQDGDLIRIGSTRIAVHTAAGAVRFGVLHHVEDKVSKPADGPPPVSSTVIRDQPSRVQPVPFTPRPIGTSRRRRRRLRPLMAVSWVGLLILAALAWYLFTLKPVEIIIEPEADRISLEGSLPVWEMAGRTLLRRGRYTLVAEKAGYYPLRTELEVTGESGQSFRFALEKLPGRLAIETAGIEDAVVLIDGRQVGLTPLAPVELAAGDYDLVIRAERYFDYETTVSIQGGDVTQTVQAVLKARWAEVTFRSEPSGARVRLDGKEAGTTPFTTQVLEGRHRAVFSLAGYKEGSTSVAVTAGQPQTLTPVRLRLLDGRLVLESQPPGATVTVDDEFKGQTPLDVTLSPGRTHRLQLSRSGYETVSREVQLRSGETSRISIPLAAKEGEVQVSAAPADAELLVNGEPRGAAKQTLRLPAVPHDLEIRKEGFETYRTTVTPRPGFPQAVQVNLKSAAQVQAEKTPPRVRSSQGHELVLIQGGRFRMGASRREPGRRANETFRDVELTRPFYLATQETSNKQFREFMSEHASGRVGSYTLELEEQPVVRLTWEEAALYCNWLSAKDSLPPVYVKEGERIVAQDPMGTGYRLPTEAEWAWAARFAAGETPLKYPWGGNLPVPAGSGNYADESVGELLAQSLDGYQDGHPATAPVDSFKPNPHGIFNLGGNVAEWIHDIYTIVPSGGDVEKDPSGPREGELHVIRGSSWMDASVSELRLTYRDYGKKERPDLGFRIARYAE